MALRRRRMEDENGETPVRATRAGCLHVPRLSIRNPFFVPMTFTKLVP